MTWAQHCIRHLVAEPGGLEADSRFRRVNPWRFPRLPCDLAELASSHPQQLRHGQGVGTAGNGAVRNPRTVIWLAATSVPVTLLVGAACYFFIGFGFGTSCTDQYGNASPQRCSAMYDWLTAGLAGQLITAGAMIVLLAGGLTAPSRRGAVTAVMSGSLALMVIWAALTSFVSSTSF